MRQPRMTFLPLTPLTPPRRGLQQLAIEPTCAVHVQKTAKDCISHLKAMRQPPMTFLPLDTLKTRPVPGHLRALGGTAKLALDLISYDQHLERAFLFCCGYAARLC